MACFIIESLVISSLYPLWPNICFICLLRHVCGANLNNWAHCSENNKHQDDELIIY
ncbi:malate dehydrogenase [Marinomonas sp. MED121]|nr:malate dehydrogenase [Marinomonas sp. MED121]